MKAPQRMVSYLTLALLLLVVWPGSASVQEIITAQIDPIADSGVSGTATVTAIGDRASLSLDVAGLTPATEYSVRLYAGSCSEPGASFGLLGALTPDDTGTAQLTVSSARMSASGAPVDLTLSLLTDGDHLTDLYSDGVGSVACGAIPAVSAPESDAAAAPGVDLVLPAAGRHDDWNTYQDLAHRFAFRYPEACPVVQHDESVFVGGRIELAILDSQRLSLPEFVRQFIDKRVDAGGWALESQAAASVSENEAIGIEYRFGGTLRYGKAIFVQANGGTYVWGLTAGVWTCDEVTVFDDVVSSFRFLE